MLKILGRRSSINVRKVLWAADELGLVYAQEDWGGEFASTRQPEFLRRNPNAMVPVIVEGDWSLWESHAILRYLAASDGAWLYPTAARARAVVDQWMDWQAAELNPAWSYAFMALVRRSEQHRQHDLIDDSLRRWAERMSVLEGQLSATGAFVTGASFSLADIPLGLSVQRWFATPFERRPMLPAVAAYFERLSTRVGFRTHGRNGLP